MFTPVVEDVKAVENEERLFLLWTVDFFFFFFFFFRFFVVIETEGEIVISD
jgi:hypothetical protein